MNKRGFDIIREAVIACQLYEYCTRAEYYRIMMMVRKMLEGAEDE